MNRDLAKYILSLKDEISLRIWLSAIAKSARNGTVNLMYRDLMLENRITRAQLDKYFNPKEAEQVEIIKILVQTDNFISLNFRKGTKQEAGTKQIKLAAIAEGEETPKEIPQQTDTNNLPSLIEPGAKDLKSKINSNTYQPTNELIKTCINDYVSFFKQLQVAKAALVGKALEDPTPPNITGEDVKHFKNLGKYFAKLPGVDTEQKVIKCFHRIYANWLHLPDFIQNKPQTRYIEYNLNTIILEIQKLSNSNGKTENKRETELNQKLNRAGQKDYSHLARKREKGD